MFAICTKKSAVYFTLLSIVSGDNYRIVWTEHVAVRAQHLSLGLRGAAQAATPSSGGRRPQAVPGADPPQGLLEASLTQCLFKDMLIYLTILHGSRVRHSLN